MITRRKFLQVSGIVVLGVGIVPFRFTEATFQPITPQQLNLLTDFKIAQVQHHKDRSATVLVRFYEGSVSTALESDIDDIGKLVNVTRYRRTAIINKRASEVAKHSDDFSVAKSNGKEWSITFKPGVDYEASLKKMLAEDSTRVPIAQRSLVSG